MEPVFKKRSLADLGPGNKKRTWKSLKQILATERTLQWSDTAVTCKLKCNLIVVFLNIHECLLKYSPTRILDSSINAPPSFRPAKKYSDISGLPANYTDPQTKLNYHNAEEFAFIRTFPGDIIYGYLALRGANSIVG